ncbi:MAG: hypothetical protein ACLTYN_03875 [Dysosmobacter welbionis]
MVPGPRGGSVRGAMGLYDGVGGTDQASVWQVADALGCRCCWWCTGGGADAGRADPGASELPGEQPPERSCSTSAGGTVPPPCSVLERETGLPVLGCLPGGAGGGPQPPSGAVRCR